MKVEKINLKKMNIRPKLNECEIFISHPSSARFFLVSNAIHEKKKSN